MTRNETRFTLDGAWRLAMIKNEELKKSPVDFSTPASIAAAGLTTIDAVVPGNVEIDLERAGIIDDPFFGTNQWDSRKWEAYHFVWFRTFTYDAEPDEYARLCFEGIDTFADIYVNGEKVGEADNMLIPHDFACAPLKKGENTITVHIRPANLEARKYALPVSSHAAGYNYESLWVRKAPHMYGWDIMPRFVSAGIWRPCYIEQRTADRIDDIFCYTLNVNPDANSANVQFFYNLTVAGDDIHEYELKITGTCGGSTFTAGAKLWHTGGKCGTNVQNAKLWWPHNYGEANIYAIKAELLRCGETVAEYETTMGIRTVALDHTGMAGDDGEFCFRVNGKKIFCMGTNWVPVDALHSRDAQRLPEILPMLTDLGCNIVRCWGGNVYEDDIFYDFCDRNGILIWQDFAMGCAINPQVPEFAEMLRREATVIVKRLRSHPCIALWAGDNENDVCIQGWTGIKRDPNNNILTRKILPEVLWAHDMTRPYLPSSPYVDEETFLAGKPSAEQHLWGPRDYFKNPFYTEASAHFASEIGYHGCPNVDSIKKFVGEDKLWPWFGEDGQPNDHWLAHAASQQPRDGYSYRIRLMANQIKVLFGDSVPDGLCDFAEASQYSQAEAKKHFIEMFRIKKWRRTGIIWWNLIDGWPQFSDAIVDYYGGKKKAYDYIKRVQTPLCLMFDEARDGQIALMAANDTRVKQTFNYTVTDLTEGRVVLSGIGAADSDTTVAIAKHPVTEGEQHFYLIEWIDGDGVTHKNHFVTGIKEIDYAEYAKNMKALD
ncbi:MAG: glycoside hydrolase family 2 [Clostridia bacterium]|nr:glycoside hydrolase family 2 [Clostridia bacterium]